MSATLDDAGLSIQTFDEILEEIIVALGAALSLTDAQTDRMRTRGIKSTLGQLARVEAERETVAQESLLAVFNALSLDATGVALDRVVRLLGVTRQPARRSEVVGTATGTTAVVIANGLRLRYDPTGTIWLVVDGPYVIGGGGTVSVRLESDDETAAVVALDPDAGFDEWTILDSLTGWSDVGSFESTSQPITGAAIETDAALRQRASVEAFRRAQGPTKSIEAAILGVEGVTFARVYENRSMVEDADGIPGKAINAVVLGGLDADVAAAIFAARSAGAQIYAQPGGTAVSEVVVDEYGFGHVVEFNRVDDVPIWIRVTLTTSTSEDTTPADVTDTVADVVLAFASAQYAIGADVLPWRIAAAVHLAGLPGIDAVTVELSDDGVTWSTSKYAISIRERATFTAGHTSVIED